ncbi:TPA: hypothetical protein DCL30_03875 [Candidatus Peribacteria bacterium]|nr:MAG: hypothetical protein A3J91_05590 [Candidatus Peribacteria bacterium RIFOXYC2_FULL_58_10]OGJ84814.1 MAG: hypothetical protein A2529_00630 [Candidatus Peribacteria bacterium RIFOXYD2_FULL_58_15]HAI98644.1 hypothetical protein [Candidatus Peribacteria bacterium]HAS34357.1 hypothetical protein [Candidatus Peribacteria bacterium]
MEPAALGILPQYYNGRHLEAYIMQEKIYRAIVQVRHRSKAALELLDFGCGVRGISRVILEGVSHDTDRLHLFDPYANIMPSPQSNVHIASTQDVHGDNRIPFDVVSLSYVLCCIETEEQAHSLLRKLRLSQPQAVTVIIDYTLRNRSNMEVLHLLNSREEQKWKESMGKDSFAETRRRFTPASLEAFVRDAGYDVLGHAAPLDQEAIRCAVLTRPSR